jgi:hypothetical protein
MTSITGLITKVYEDFLSRGNLEISDSEEFCSKVYDAVSSIEGFDEATGQFRYAITFHIMELMLDEKYRSLPYGGSYQFKEFMTLDNENMWYASADCTWMPDEMIELDDMLWQSAYYAGDIILGIEKANTTATNLLNESITQKIAEIWAAIPQMQCEYCDHLYLSEMLFELESEFYKDKVVLDTGDIGGHGYSEKLGNYLEDANYQPFLESKMQIETIDTGGDEVLASLCKRGYSSMDELTEVFNQEGYNVKPNGDGSSFDVTVSIGENSHGYLN